MAETIRWDGKLWTVTRGEYVWTLTGQARKGAMYPPTRQVRIADAPTFEAILPALEAEAAAKLAAEHAAWEREKARRAAPIATPASQTREGAIIGAIDRGIPLEQIEAALEGRPHKPGRTVLRCRRCRQTGYAGSYPFSTGYDSGLCDDCGG